MLNFAFNKHDKVILLYSEHFLVPFLQISFKIHMNKVVLLASDSVFQQI